MISASEHSYINTQINSFKFRSDGRGLLDARNYGIGLGWAGQLNGSCNLETILAGVSCTVGTEMKITLVLNHSMQTWLENVLTAVLGKLETMRIIDV